MSNTYAVTSDTGKLVFEGRAEDAEAAADKWAADTGGIAHVFDATNGLAYLGASEWVGSGGGRGYVRNVPFHGPAVRGHEAFVMVFGAERRIPAGLRTIINAVCRGEHRQDNAP